MSHRKRTYIYILVLHRIVNIHIGTIPYSEYTLRRFHPLTAPSVSQVAKPLHWSSMHAIWIHHIWLVQVVVFYIQVITFVIVSVNICIRNVPSGCVSSTNVCKCARAALLDWARKGPLRGLVRWQYASGYIQINLMQIARLIWPDYISSMDRKYTFKFTQCGSIALLTKFSHKDS